MDSSEENLANGSSSEYESEDDNFYNFDESDISEDPTQNSPPSPYFKSDHLPDFVVKRIMNDIKEFHNSPPDGIHLEYDDQDISNMVALIEGPEGTPYEGGMFLFKIWFTTTYPYNPPKVKFLTTGSGQVRFNPNLYACGKVCLSILGTWQGPPWAPSMTLGHLLMSIQSLLNEAPFHNEPAFHDQTKHKVESGHYNEYVEHETLRIGVISHIEQLLQKEIKPGGIDETSLKTFLSKIDYYKQKAESLKDYKKGQKFKALLGIRDQVYCYEKFTNVLPNLEETVRKCLPILSKGETWVIRDQIKDFGKN